MTTMEAESRAARPPKKYRSILKQFNWRMILVRILINALALILVALLVPKIYFVDKTLLSVLVVALGLGILNALVKPIIQFLTLQFIFVTLGFVVILINTIMLWLLSVIFDQRFAIDGFIWAFVGGALMGILTTLLESLLGLNVPIVLDESGQYELPHARPSPVENLLLGGMVEEETLGEEVLTPIEPAEAPAPVADKPTSPPAAETAETAVADITETVISAVPAAGAEPETEPAEPTQEDER